MLIIFSHCVHETDKTGNELGEAGILTIQRFGFLQANAKTFLITCREKICLGFYLKI